MSRTMINLLLDTCLMLFTVSLLFTAAVLRVVFPAASAADGWTLWGGDYDAWASVQFVLVSIIGLAVLLHVMLHWSWVTGVIVTRVMGRPARDAKTDTGTKTLWGVAMLIVILNIVGALVGLAYLMIDAPGVS